MELLEGKTLRDCILGRPLPTDQLLATAIEIAEGLDAAHAKGIRHRDIKPGNIFMIGRGHAKILDFGLAKVASETHSSATSLGAAPTVIERSPPDKPGTPGAPSLTCRLSKPRRGTRCAHGSVLLRSGPVRNGHRSTGLFR